MTRLELTTKVKESVRSLDPDARVIVFGSRARGDDTPTSDWDFLILISGPVNDYLKRKIRSGLIDTELEAEEVISTLIYSQDHWKDYVLTPLYKNISLEGVEI